VIALTFSRRARTLRRLTFITACLAPLFADLAVSYIEQRSLKAGTTQDFWLQGGSMELGLNVWRSLGIAANVTGSHAASIGSSGVPLSLVTATLGPRYRWHSGHKISIYGEALVGEAHGFDSTFPAPGGSQSTANSFAVQLGGGVDLRLNHRFSVRLIDAGWLRTQLPNSTDTIQNTLRVGAGFALRFGH
jgi:hypothetical protein